MPGDWHPARTELLILAGKTPQPFPAIFLEYSRNQTALLTAAIRHDSLAKCRPPTRSEGGLELVRGVLGMGDDEIGVALS